MPPKEQTHRSDKTSAKSRVKKLAAENLSRAAQQPTHPAPIIQRARLDPRSLTPNNVLQLQRTMGNQAAGRLLAQTEPQQSQQKDSSPGARPGQLNQSVQAKAFTAGQALTYGTTEERHIQRVAWTGAPELVGLDLQKISSSKLIYDAEEDGGVWRVSIEGKSYILKATSEGAGPEIFATTLAGVLGANSPTIAEKEVTEEEANSLANTLEAGDCDLPEEGRKVLIQQDLGGKNLDQMKEKKGRILLLRDYEKMGEMATIDIIIGIGDRFDIGRGGNVNFANIVLGTDGNVHPIDYDISQSEVGDSATPFNEAMEKAILSQGKSIAEMVFAALMDKRANMAGMVIHDENEIKQAVLKGHQTVLNRLTELPLEMLEEIKEEGEKVMDEAYGTGVVMRIKSFTESLKKESKSLVLSSLN